jgi:conjugative transfer pilus assembly protein TraH
MLSTRTIKAGTADKVNEWFAHQNYVNVTNPGVYEGQTARYMTLGGVSTRSEIIRPFRFVDIQTPKFSAGCGGIDFYTGGLSAVNADQFIEGLRSIGQNVQSLAFMLAIQIVSPQLSGVMENIQTWANKYLNMNLDSCQAATKMVGGTLDYFGAKEGNCVVKRMQDFSESWDVAKHNCTTGGQIKATESSGEVNRIDFIKGNLAWYVLMQDPFFKNDTEFSELVMNLTGTIIIADSNSADDGPSQITVIDPAISDEVRKDRFENIYSALLDGSESKNNLMIYRCQDATPDPHGCTKVSESMTSIKPNWDGLKFRIQKIVKSIVQKIYKDEPLSSEERGVISSTTIPLYRFLTVTSAYFPRNNDISRSINDYVKLIAEDILLRSLNAIISKVEQQTSMTQNADSKRVLAYKQNVQKVLRGISLLARENNENANKYLEMQQRIQMYEKTLMSRLSSGIVTSAMWGSR